MGDEGKSRLAHGYDFSRVDAERVYTLREAAEVLGMSREEMARAYRRGSVRTVRATWNDRIVFVRGSELLRVAQEEFVDA